MADQPLKVALVALNRPGYQSLALGYLRAYAEADTRLKGKVAFQTLDLTTDVDPWRTAYRLLRMGPDVVAFSVYCWNAPAIYEACSIIRDADHHLKIILGGPEVSAVAEDVVGTNPAVDAIVRGEGEETFDELLRVIATGKRMWMCPGVTARNRDEVVSAPDRPLIDDLDTIPSPYLTGLLSPTEALSYIETYRGCPHNCSYCFEGKGSTRIRSFSKERIAADINAVATAPGVKSFTFVDSVFNLTPDRLHWLADMLEPHARRGLTLHTIEVDIERIDAEQALDLRRAGVVSVETGPQSIGMDALQACHRNFDSERFARGVAELKRQGISVECDLIFGLPGDDAFDVIGGLRWLFRLDPGVVQSSTLHVLPGTDLCERSQELGLEYESQSAHAVIQTREISFADIRRLEVMATAMQSSYRARL
ncbi:MAG: radical SAM protein [Coriobacteriia bacterium]|nr:radical SAM protein [Coriobacteriia bacterium]